MFRSLFLATPLWDDEYTIQGQTQFPCFGFLRLARSHLKESGTLLLNWPTSFLTFTSKQWGPLFLKEGGLIRIAQTICKNVKRFYYWVNSQYDRCMLQYYTCLYRIMRCLGACPLRSVTKKKLERFNSSTVTVDWKTKRQSIKVRQSLVACRHCLLMLQTVRLLNMSKVRMCQGVSKSRLIRVVSNSKPVGANLSDWKLVESKSCRSRNLSKLHQRRWLANYQVQVRFRFDPWSSPSFKTLTITSLPNTSPKNVSSTNNFWLTLTFKFKHPKIQIYPCSPLLLVFCCMKNLPHYSHTIKI